MNTEPSPYTRAALFVIRLIAFGFMIFSFSLLWEDVFLVLSHHRPHHLHILMLKGIPFLFGMFVFWKSHDMARYLTDDLD